MYRTKEQLERLLREWGAQAIEFRDRVVGEAQVIELRFVWMFEDIPLSARFRLATDEDDLRERSRHGRTGQVLETKLERNRANWGRESLRLLYMFLKTSLHAVDEGVITAEQLFMPWFEDNEGRVLSEVLDLYQLSKGMSAGQLMGQTTKLLAAGG